MNVQFSPTPPFMGKHAELTKDTGIAYRYFVDCVKDDARLRGRVIDIGCGEWPTILLTEELFPIYQLAGDLDGIDPFPGVSNHPWLTRHWVGLLTRECAVPSQTYDAAIAINVIEHVPNAEDFLAGVFRILKPGGAFYATTPSSRHPFAWSVRAIETLGLKKRMAASDANANDYPAYYRCNSVSAVTRAAAASGFSQVTFYNHPAVNWRQHLPGPTKAVGWLYDELLGTRVRACAQQCMFRLDKPGSAAGPMPAKVSKVHPVPSARSTRESVARSEPSHPLPTHTP